MTRLNAWLVRVMFPLAMLVSWWSLISSRTLVNAALNLLLLLEMTYLFALTAQRVWAPLPTKQALERMTLEELLAEPPSYAGRVRWALHFGADPKRARSCARRGRHAWNEVGCFDDTVHPLAPTVCNDCDAKYTEEWDAAKLRHDRRGWAS